MYTVDELVALAKAYLAAKPEITPTRLGIRCADNDRLFHRLFAGAGCHNRTLEASSKWFDDNWPIGVAWPLPASTKPQRRRPA